MKSGFRDKSESAVYVVSIYVYIQPSSNRKEGDCIRFGFSVGGYGSGAGYDRGGSGGGYGMGGGNQYSTGGIVEGDTPTIYRAIVRQYSKKKKDNLYISKMRY